MSINDCVPKKLTPNWYLINAKNKILGRLVTKIVYYLLGKNTPNYLPYLNRGDYVIVINARYVLVSGNKRNNKFYYRHSGYVGNMRCFSFNQMINKNPEYIIRVAVKGMLPKNSLSSLIMSKKLKIYANKNHQHHAQKPILLI